VRINRDVRQPLRRSRTQVRHLRGTGRHSLAMQAHLMTTSGVFRSTVDLLITCDGLGGCGWAGWVEAIDDREDMTSSYACPGCGYPEVLELGRDEDH